MLIALTLAACSDEETTDPGQTLPPAVVSVVVTPASATLGSLGETVQLTASARDASGNTTSGKTFTWSSSDESLAMVSSSGEVTALANGSVTITATTDGVNGTAAILVDQAVFSTVVTPGLATLGSLGETVQLAASALDGNGNPISDKTFTWMSSDNGIATVSTGGLVTGVANGSVTITATADAIDGAATVVVTTSFAYVTHRSSNTASVIKIASNTVVATIEVGDVPGEVAITPDGTFAYVPIIPTQPGAVSVIETASNTVVGTVGVGLTPIYVAITPDGSLAYVANVGSRTVSVIETASNTVVATIQVGDPGVLPRAVAITPDGSLAYVNLGDDCPGTVAVIEIASNSVIATIDLAHCAGGQVAITPDGRFAYVTDGRFNSVSVIETASNTVVATIPARCATAGVAITPDGAFAYVADCDTVSVIAIASNTVVTTIDLESAASDWVAITPDGAFVYVTLPLDDALAVISTVTNTVVATIDVGLRPFAIAITPF
jgi:YVTN family beta-propeller protein